MVVAFSARGWAAVIAVVEDNGVVCQSIGFKLSEDFANLRVGGSHDVVVAGDVATNFREVGHVTRKSELGGIHPRFRRNES